MQLRVFADEAERLHLEISSPSLIYQRRLFVPMLPAQAPVLEGVDANTLVEASYEGSFYRVPYLLVHSEDARLKDWKEVGKIGENDSRNILNHLLDILAWD